jgi:transposase
MKRKLQITASEMLEMRKQGMSNHDIAKSLDISYPTVLRYIGKQGGHMEGLDAFKDAPSPKKEEAKEEVKPVIPKYDPKPVLERFVVGGCDVTMDAEAREILIRSCGGEFLSAYDDIPDLVQFLAWAMRERMEVKADAEDQLQAEGCEI